MTVRDGLPADHEAAVRVWRAGNVARLLPPRLDRVARIWEKLAEPEACLVIGHLDTDWDVVAMALAEPGRSEHGAGVVIPGYGHVSMVFVHPDMCGRGVGRQLLQGLHQRASERGWSRSASGLGIRTGSNPGATPQADSSGRPLSSCLSRTGLHDLRRACRNYRSIRLFNLGCWMCHWGWLVRSWCVPRWSAGGGE